MLQRARVVLFSAFLIPVAATVSAQSIGATIAGTVRDASGAVLPGVTVTLASPAGGITVSRTLAPYERGPYLFPSLVSAMFLLFWEIHYVYRTVIFTSLMREGQKQFPILLVLFALIFNVLNGFVNGYHLFLDHAHYGLAWLMDPRFLTGTVVFFFGFVTHVRSDRLLRGLRAPGETSYSIPYGGMFRFVSSTNYLGEIVQWIGWAILTWSVAGLAFAFFTFANLFPRAIANHRWYRDQFDGEYPEERKAIIPFLL